MAFCAKEFREVGAGLQHCGAKSLKSCPTLADILSRILHIYIRYIIAHLTYIHPIYLVLQIIPMWNFGDISPHISQKQLCLKYYPAYHIYVSDILPSNFFFWYIISFVQLCLIYYHATHIAQIVWYIIAHRLIYFLVIHIKTLSYNLIINILFSYLSAASHVNIYSLQYCIKNLVWFMHIHQMCHNIASVVKICGKLYIYNLYIF